MGKERIQKKRKEYLLKLLCEENNTKSPDILTAVVVAREQMEAYMIATIYERVTGEDLPFNLDRWELSVKPPVELYFAFKRMRDRGRFVRAVTKGFPDVTIVC